MKINSLVIFFFSLFALYSQVLQAEIYRYKDEKGRWQFTDKKPTNQKNVTVDKSSVKTVSSNPENRSDWFDLSASLHEKYNPTASIESATLAVVKIETIVGVGSGFFVSDDGYIITNKHVVRPQESSSWEKEEGSLKEEAQSFKEKFSLLKSRKERLNLMKDELRAFKHQLDYPNQYDNPISQKGYDYHERLYAKDYKSYRKSYKKTNYHYVEFKKRKKSKTRRGLNAAVARNFNIIFKDGSKARAHLFKISKKYDIAILKINNHITPFLTVAAKQPSQAERVYAIGSPLGQSDSVTSGVFTKINSKEIITDATILPGNSGGPLMDRDGGILGVNTLKFMAGSQDGSEGFGIAIPIEHVFNEFGSIFLKSKTQ